MLARGTSAPEGQAGGPPSPLDAPAKGLSAPEGQTSPDPGGTQRSQLPVQAEYLIRI